MTVRPYVFTADDIRRIEYAIALMESSGNTQFVESNEIADFQQCIADLEVKINLVKALYDNTSQDGMYFSDIGG